MVVAPSKLSCRGLKMHGKKLLEKADLLCGILMNGT